jgi:DNA-binding NtrC family response regulator
MRSPAGGARFTLALRIVAPAHPVPISEGAAAGPGSESDPFVGRRTLVVEDEAPLQTLQDRILSRTGGEVLLAVDGAEARRVLERTDVDLVISDVPMPGEGGLDLFRWILRERPSLPWRFLFFTGDIGAPEFISLAERWPGTFVHKPFEVEEYLRQVRTIDPSTHT